MKVLDQEIFGVGGERRSFLDLVQRSNRRGDLPLLDRFEKADIAQSVQRRRHQSGADIDAVTVASVVDSVSMMRI